MKNALRRRKLAARFRIELIREFGLRVAKPGRAISLAEKAIVLRGRFRGEPVVFKQYLEPGVPDIVIRAAAELQFLEANLREPFFANRCIATVPAIGAIVLSWVPGQQVYHLLTGASASRRNEILQLAGGWIKACVDLRSQGRAVRSQGYVRRLQMLGTQGLAAEERDMIEKMLVELRRLALALQGRQVIHAVAHDDFAPPNLYYFAGGIHAVDIQGAHWEPVMRMAARFLVMKDLHDPPRESDLFHGLDAAAAGLFLKAAGVEVAQKRIVRFFIGEQMVLIYLNRISRLGQFDKPALARQRLNAFLAASGVGAVRGTQARGTQARGTQE